MTDDPLDRIEQELSNALAHLVAASTQMELSIRAIVAIVQALKASREK